MDVSVSADFEGVSAVFEGLNTRVKGCSRDSAAVSLDVFSGSSGGGVGLGLDGGVGIDVHINVLKTGCGNGIRRERFPDFRVF